MKKMVANIKKHFLPLICILEIIILSVIALCGAVSHVKDFDVAFNMYPTQIDIAQTDDAGSVHINNSEYKGVFAEYYLESKINKGIYNVSVQYESETSANYLNISSDPSYAVRADRIAFYHNENERTFRIWVDENIDVLRFSADYAGSGALSIHEVSITGAGTGAGTSLFWLCIIFIFIDIIIYIKQKRPDYAADTNRLIVAVGIVVITCLASYPVFTNYITTGHDLGYHLMRIDGIEKGLLSGQFPVRIYPHYFGGSGFAGSIFYADLFMYFPALLKMIGFTVMDSYKIFLVCVNLATCLITYFSFKKVYNDKLISLLGSFLYTFATYRLCNLYVRCSVGEYIAMMFIPIIARSLYMILRYSDEYEKRKNEWIPLAIGFSGLLHSHMITLELSIVLSVIIALLYFNKTFKKQTLIILGKTIGTFILINLAFLVPLIDSSFFAMTKNTVYEQSLENNIQGKGAFVTQLFMGFPIADGGMITNMEAIKREMPHNIGWALLFGLCVFIYSWIISSKNKPETVRDEKIVLKTGIIGTVFGVLCLFLSTYLFPYDKLKSIPVISTIVGSIQFPWRFLLFASFFLALASLAGIYILKKNSSKVFTAAVACLIVFNVVSGVWLCDQRLVTSDKYTAYSESAHNYNDFPEQQQFLPVDTNVNELIRYPESVGDQINIIEYNKDALCAEITCENIIDKESYLNVPLINYKGYRAEDKSTSDKLEIRNGDNNVVQVVVPANYYGTISVRFTEPWYWRIADIVSWITILSVAVYFICFCKHKKRLR